MDKTCAECGIDFQGRRGSRYCSPVCYFWARLDKSAGPDGCWIWTGSVNPKNGYGIVDSHTGGGKRTTPHRHAYRLTHGDPGELSVLHRCDVRLCGNPRHLFTGTPRDNWWDSVAKGRQTVVAPGEANRSAKLSAAEVQAIRRSAARVADLVRQYPVSDSTIRSILHGHTWRHVPQDGQAQELAPAD
jgi:hypothetical protein